MKSKENLWEFAKAFFKNGWSFLLKAQKILKRVLMSRRLLKFYLRLRRDRDRMFNLLQVLFVIIDFLISASGFVSNIVHRSDFALSFDVNFLADYLRKHLDHIKLLTMHTIKMEENLWELQTIKQIAKFLFQFKSVQMGAKLASLNFFSVCA